MINNRFIRFKTLAAYNSAMSKGEISPASIVFVLDEQAIYNDGVRYSGGSSLGDLGEKIERIREIISDDFYNALNELRQFVTDHIAQGGGSDDNDEWREFYNQLSMRINALEGLIELLAQTQGTTINDEYITNKVQMILNSMEPSWSVIVSKIATLEDFETETRAALASIRATIDEWEAQVTLEAIFRALGVNGWQEFVARIFLWANEDGSGIELEADKINLDGLITILNNHYLQKGEDGGYDDSLVQARLAELQSWLNARTYLTGAGLIIDNQDNSNYIELTSDGGLQHYNRLTDKSAFELKLDGSGHLGYVSGTKEHAISWDTDGNVYIHGIPDPNGRYEGKYYEQAFKTTTTTDVPAVPNNYFPNGNDGWKKYADNADGSKYVWMCTRLYSTGDNPTALGEWQGPWRINGPAGAPGAPGAPGAAGADGINGTNGKDGNGIEFVYARTNTMSVSSLRDLNANHSDDADSEYQHDDFIPQGWNDNAIGIDPTMQYEWIGYREGSAGNWSRFVGPILWSKWGQNGTDGDGIEYIFCYTADGNLPNTDDYHPERWNASQDDEYLGGAGSRWSDNPIDISSMPEGSIVWCSVRKQRNGEWGIFSVPAMWSIKAYNGVVDGYTVDLSNQNMPVGTDAEGNVESYTNTCKVTVWHVSEQISNFGISYGEFTRSDGETVTNAQCDVTHDSNGVITVTLSNLSNFSSKTLSIPVIVTLPNDTTRTLVITCYGAGMGEPGEDAEAIDLHVNANIIRRNYYRSVVSPNEISVGVKVNDNLYDADSQYASDNGYTFKYRFDQQELQSVSGHTITIVPNNVSDYDTLSVFMYKGGNLIDFEQIPFVNDGRDGINGAEAINYSINLLENSLVVEDGTMSGTVVFNATKSQAGDVSYIVNNSVESFEVTVNGSEETPSYDGGQDSSWTISVDDVTYTGSNGFVSIVLRNDVDRMLAGIVAVATIKGDKGDQGNPGQDGDTQSLSGIVMRFTGDWDQDTTYSNGSTAENGVYYMDIVYHDGYYWRSTISSNRGSEPADDNNDWSKFTPMDDAYINNLIVNNAYINSLTAKQVVVTDEDNTVVGGLVSNSTVLPNQIENNQQIRLFAGPISSNGDLSQAPFYVKNDGSGNIGNGGLVWNYNSNSNKWELLLNGSSVLVGGEDVMTQKEFTDQLADGSTLYTFIRETAGEVDPEVISEYLEKHGLDLEGYVKTGDLPDFTTYAKSSDLNSAIKGVNGSITNVNNQITQLTTTNGLQTASITNLGNRITNLEGQAGSYVQTSTYADDKQNVLATKAELASYVQDSNDILKKSSLETWADEQGTGFSLSALVQELTNGSYGDNDIKANIIGIVKDGKSSLELSADDIDIDGSTIDIGDNDSITTLNSGLVTLQDNIATINGTLSAGTVRSNEVFVEGTPDEGDSYQISIDENGIDFISGSGYPMKVNPDGSGMLADGAIEWNENGKMTIASDVTINADITAHSLTAANNNYTSTINSNGMSMIYNSVNALTINADGSGSTANGAISWDAQGNVTIHGGGSNVTFDWGHHIDSVIITKFIRYAVGRRYYVYGTISYGGKTGAWGTYLDEDTTNHEGAMLTNLAQNWSGWVIDNNTIVSGMDAYYDNLLGGYVSTSGDSQEDQAVLSKYDDFQLMKTDVAALQEEPENGGGTAPGEPEEP